MKSIRTSFFGNTYIHTTVTLANGSQTVAKGIGLALPLPYLPLTSVLYTPECPFNLISISKIILIALLPFLINL